METEQSLTQRMQNGEERHPSYQQGDDGQGDALSHPLAFGAQASEISCYIPEVEEIGVAGHWLSAREREPVYQRQANGQIDGLSYPMATDGKNDEIFCPIQEMEEFADHVSNAHEWQQVNQRSDVGGSNSLNHSMFHGEEVMAREESSIQETVACQLVNGQQQPRYQQSMQANELSFPTQEMGLNTRHRQDRQEVPCPIQETGHFVERTPDENKEMSPFCQQLSGADVNGVSSTGQTEHAVEHNCSCQELQLWKQELDRQAYVTHTTSAWEIKYMSCHDILGKQQCFNHFKRGAEWG